MSEKLPLLFNPQSGSVPKNPDALMAKLSPELRTRILPLSLSPPYDYREPIERAFHAKGPLFVWGGDGTIHHAAKALLSAGCPVPLAAIPGGSGNGLVRGLRTPLEPAGALRCLFEGHELRMDVPRLDGEPFFNLCGTGFEGAVAHAFEHQKGRGLGGYVRTVWRLWRHHPEMQLRWDALQPKAQEPQKRWDILRAAWRGPELPLPDRAWSLCFANLPQYGSGLWIAPHADPTDGILQWAMLRRPEILDFFGSVPALFREGARSGLRQEGRFLRGVVYLDQAQPWHLDGEPVVARNRVELSLESRVFRMQVTAGCPWV